MSNNVELAMSHEPEKAAMPLYELDEKRALTGERSPSSISHQPHQEVEFEADLEGEEPTEEELRTLQRVSGKIPWTAFTIAFVELCERFGYYGCQVLCTLLPYPCIQPLTSGRHQLHPTGASCH
jgi:POT family proton-dependent oligopeptide transporter